MKSIKLYYDDVSNEVFDANGKTYPIKEYNRSKQVNIGKEKIRVSSLEKKPLIRSFDDVISHYAICWNVSFPCPAIEYYVLKKETKKIFSLKEFYKNYKKA